MAVKAGSRSGGRAGRAQEAAKQKERRQKGLLIGGAVILLLLLAIEGPKTLKALTGKSTPASPPLAQPISSQSSPSAAVPIATAGPAGLTRGLRRLPAKDPFVVQVAVASTAGTTTSAPSVKLSAGPSVRPSHFTTKDPFVVQVALAAPATPVATSTYATPAKQTVSSSGVTSGAAYIVVLAKPSAAAPAIREVVAAQNAGLKDVKVLGSQKASTAPGGTFTVYTGPYATHAEAVKELVRALRVGYDKAFTRRNAGGE